MLWIMMLQLFMNKLIINYQSKQSVIMKATIMLPIKQSDSNQMLYQWN